MQCKKTHEKRVSRSATVAIPMSDPPAPPEAYRSNFGDLPKLLHKHLLVLRMCKLAHLSRPDHRV